MINLTKAPFFLVKEDIEWVENTKKAMTLEEKIGQLFVPIGYSGDADYLEHYHSKYSSDLLCTGYAEPCKLSQQRNGAVLRIPECIQ